MAKNKDGLQNKCSKCKQEYGNRWYHKRSPGEKLGRLRSAQNRVQQNQLKLLNYLEGKCCVNCKEDSPEQLRFVSLKTRVEVQIRKLITGGAAWGKVYKRAEVCDIKCKVCIGNKSKSTIKAKRHDQLGMNASTASSRLVKDLLFMFLIKDGHTCFQCGEELTRETFSIEHKEPWLDSEDPKKVFFDLNNIAFSHHSCNSSAGRQPNKKYFSGEEIREANNRRNRECRERKKKV